MASAGMTVCGGGGSAGRCLGPGWARGLPSPSRVNEVDRAGGLGVGRNEWILEISKVRTGCAHWRRSEK